MSASVPESTSLPDEPLFLGGTNPLIMRRLAAVRRQDPHAPPPDEDGPDPCATGDYLVRLLREVR